jgi:Peptidase M15
MSATADQLHQLGWKTRTTWETHQALVNFQAGYALGTALKADGIAGPKTNAALADSIAHGGRASDHFTFREFACHCAQTLDGCEGIRINRAVVVSAEQTRASLYPSGLRVVSGYRCPRHNSAVGGARSSRHLVGAALDVEPAATVADMAALNTWQGIGFSPSRHKVVHVDHRAETAIFPDGA